MGETSAAPAGGCLPGRVSEVLGWRVDLRAWAACAPSGVDAAHRQVMTTLKQFQKLSRPKQILVLDPGATFTTETDLNGREQSIVVLSVRATHLDRLVLHRIAQADGFTVRSNNSATRPGVPSGGRQG